METTRKPEFTDTETPPDYQQKLNSLFNKYNVEVPLKVQLLLDRQLESLFYRYGDPNSPDYREYHDDSHSFGNIDRGLHIITKLSPHIKLDEKLIEILTISTAYHDDILDADETATSEERSALAAISSTKDLDYASNEHTRIAGAILSTTVAFDDKGVHQTELYAKDRDIARFALAFADVGATIMEGRSRMIKDVVNLSLEQYRTQDHHVSATIPTVLVPLLKMQPSFVAERLADLDKMIDHYFAQYGQVAVSEIKHDLYEDFTPSIIELREVFTRVDKNTARITDMLHERLSPKELKGHIGSSEQIQAKLNEIVSKL